MSQEHCKKKVYFHVITNFTELGGAESNLIKLINSTTDYTFLISLMGVSMQMRTLISNPNCSFISLGSKNFLSIFLSSFKLCFYLLKFNPSKVYSWMYHANIITSFANILLFRRFILIWCVRHSLDDFSGEKKSTKLAIYLGMLFRFIPKSVIYCSSRSKNQHIAFGYSKLMNSVYIPNGYILKPLRVKSFVSDTIILGSAGRFHDSKDYLTLFKMFKRLKKYGLSVKLKVCGRGMEANNKELLQLIDDSNLHSDDIILYGELSNMSSFYNQIDIFIMTSKTEGFPNVLAEAASHGCAVFSTNVGDAPVIINNPSHIVPVYSDKILASKIINFILADSDVKKNITLATTTYVRDNFDIKNITKQFLDI